MTTPSPSDLIPLLEETRAELVATLDRIPSGSREQPESRGRWSAAQLLEHLAASEASVLKVLDRLERTWREGDEARQQADPTVDGIDGDGWRAFLGDRSRRLDAPDFVRPAKDVAAEQALDHLGRTREALMKRVRSIEGGWVRRARFPHPFLGPLTALEWIEFVARHEQRHTRQLAEIARAVTGDEAS